MHGQTTISIREKKVTKLVYTIFGYKPINTTTKMIIKRNNSWCLRQNLSELLLIMEQT